jgi:hypothetical protein
VLGSLGGLMLVLFKSNCLKIKCCFGLVQCLNTQAGHLKIKCWSQNGSTRRKSVKEAQQIARGQIGRRLRYALKNKGRL